VRPPLTDTGSRADVASRMDAGALVGALGIGRGDVLSFVGAGGKTTLLLATARGARSLGLSTVVTTTTRMWPVQAEDARGLGVRVVMGGRDGAKAAGIDSAEVDRLHADPTVDLVVVEADGSRGRAAKAPASHEPVIARSTTLVVPVLGAPALGGTISEVCHRPGLMAGLAGVGEDHSLDVEVIAALWSSAHGAFRNVPETARVVAVVNQVADFGMARHLADRILRCTTPEGRTAESVVLVGRAAVGAGPHRVELREREKMES